MRSLCWLAIATRDDGVPSVFGKEREVQLRMPVSVEFEALCITTCNFLLTLVEKMLSLGLELIQGATRSVELQRCLFTRRRDVFYLFL